MFVRKTVAGYEIWTSAKLNLTLDVLARRADGFHELRSRFEAITLYDTLFLDPIPGTALRMTCEWATAAGQHDAVPGGADNLIIQALSRLQQRCGVRQGAEVHLVKRIPTQAGLGGGSSDAAAALIAARAAWGLGCSLDELRGVAAEIGSDVAFFLHPSPAECRGRGELVERASPWGRLDFVVVKPPVGLSTPAVFRQCVPRGELSPRVSLSAIPVRTALADGLSNDLQAAARELTPWVERLEDVFRGLGVVAHQLSGSGTAYFGLCHHHRQAARLFGRLRGMGLGQVFLASSDPGYTAA